MQPIFPYHAKKLRVAALNALLFLGLIVFSYGFFPTHVHLSHSTERPLDDVFVSQNYEEHAPFDKIIFMVIDALRSDFLFSADSKFSFLQSLIRDGGAMPFTSHAGPPTITLPRLKAITTGSVPSFVDVILSFAESASASNLTQQDSWIRQLKESGRGKLLMFGDDTWLNLFPHSFDRVDGTSSFLVSDFTEVDQNVTRNVAPELVAQDWSGMVLHYLGLDHIGHKSGPKSPFMPSKQQEMDTVIQTIFEAIEHKLHLQKTLFVICGDHGMNEAGNHGGSSFGETSAGLVFVSPHMRSIYRGTDSPVAPFDGRFAYHNKVDQSDISATLSALLGIPIPINSHGNIIKEFLSFWTESSTFPADCSALSSSDRLRCFWIQAENSFHNASRTSEDKIRDIYAYTNLAQMMLSSSADTYRLGYLYLGLSLCIISTIFTAIILFRAAKSQAMFNAYIILMGSLSGCIMFASSYIEEEHHFWYWALSIWLVCLFVARQRRAHKSLFSTFHGLLAFILLRFLRSWNQTGQKHSGEADIGRTFLPSHSHLLWLLVTFGIFSGLYMLPESFPRSGLGQVIHAGLIALCGMIFSFKFISASLDAPGLISGFEFMLHFLPDSRTLILQGQLIFTGLLILAILCIWNSWLATHLRSRRAEVGMHHVIELLLIMQTRVTNIPIFIILHVQFHFLEQLEITLLDTVLASSLLQTATFFAFGGSNAISSLDLSNSYNGIESYSAIKVGILAFTSNWAGPIWCFSRILLVMANNDQVQRIGGYEMYAVLSTFSISVNITAVMTACILMRSHLFIWTVFSPRFLLTIAWTIYHSLEVLYLFTRVWT